jgi:hypothetical protein
LCFLNLYTKTLYSCWDALIWAPFLSLHFNLSGKPYVLPRYDSNLICVRRSQRFPVLQITEMECLRMMQSRTYQLSDTNEGA